MEGRAVGEWLGDSWCRCDSWREMVSRWGSWLERQWLNGNRGGWRLTVKTDGYWETWFSGHGWLSRRVNLLKRDVLGLRMVTNKTIGFY